MEDGIQKVDFLIIGAGVIGLTTARELLKRGHRNILVLEKEASLGKHSSGRNSGVLHAGFYYGTDSLKAKVCAEGSALLFAYAEERGISVKRSGKVVVPTTPEAIPLMRELLKRAQASGIPLEAITHAELKRLEPEAPDCDEALYSPKTAIIDSVATLIELEKELKDQKVEILKNQKVVAIDALKHVARTETLTIQFGHLINCSGLHADTIAHWMGVGTKYKILPFKGVYRKLKKEIAAKYNGSIYPVPDLRVPFLGVHVTRNIFGDVYVGPTAIPAFGRENYGVLEGASAVETPRIVWELTQMVFKNTQGMRRMIFEELGRYSSAGFLKAARAVSPHLNLEDFETTGKVGLRAQLFDRSKGSLEMDFVIESGVRSTHVLNAISPAFTASMAFAKRICDQVEAPSHHAI